MNKRGLWLVSMALSVAVLLGGCDDTQEPRKVAEKEYFTYKDMTFIKPRPKHTVCPPLEAGGAYSDKLRLYIGGRTFSIHKDQFVYARPPIETGLEGFSAFNNGCEAKGETPYLANRLTTWIPRSGFLLDKEERPGFGHVGQIAMFGNRAKSQDLYNQYRDLYNQYTNLGIHEESNRQDFAQEIDFDSLEVVSGFYKLPIFTRDTPPKLTRIWFFIPLDKSFQTPRGNPVVFQCATRAVGSECHTQFVYKGELEVHILNLTDEWAPASKIRAYYDLALAYLHEIDITEQIDKGAQ